MLLCLNELYENTSGITINIIYFKNILSKWKPILQENIDIILERKASLTAKLGLLGPANGKRHCIPMNWQTAVHKSQIKFTSNLQFFKFVCSIFPYIPVIQWDRSCLHVICPCCLTGGQTDNVHLKTTCILTGCVSRVHELHVKSGQVSTNKTPEKALIYRFMR